jgi:hypothetical protein
MANKSLPSGHAKKPGKTAQEKKLAKREKKEAQVKFRKGSI